MLKMVAYVLTNNDKYLKSALQDMNYITGVNPTGYCYITGIGEKSPMNIHHRPSGSDGIAEPVPGFLAGGPNTVVFVDCPNAVRSKLPALSYVDEECSYSTNEIAINWNTPLAFLAGALSNLSETEQINRKTLMFPEGFILGLSTGAVCLAYCGPVLLPFILGEGTTVMQNAKSVGLFLGGRLVAYILVGFFSGLLGLTLVQHSLQNKFVFRNHIYPSGLIYDRLRFLQVQGNMSWTKTKKAAAEAKQVACCNPPGRWICHGAESLSSFPSGHNRCS